MGPLGRLVELLIDLVILIVAILLVTACNVPPERGAASECGPGLSAAQSCTHWYSGGR